MLILGIKFVCMLLLLGIGNKLILTNKESSIYSKMFEISLFILYTAITIYSILWTNAVEVILKVSEW